MNHTSPPNHNTPSSQAPDLAVHALRPQSSVLSPRPGLGAIYLGGGRCDFVVWAPFREHVDVHIVAPVDHVVPMERGPDGYHTATVVGLEPGGRYRFRLDADSEYPDPASRSQPDGVHGPSAVVDLSAVHWGDEPWPGLPLDDLIFYELHVGTFTENGTLDAAIAHLDELQDLGITAVELMPVAQFPGTRNWGYDGVYPFAVQHSYGGLESLQRFVNACHQRRLAVVLDVVYNHLGPEGNYLGQYGPYFTDFYRTPWGPAINFDGPHSDEVQRYFIENALYWFTACHVDALRLDAVHAIRDFSAQPFLRKLATAATRRAGELRRRLHLIAESDLNDARLILPRELGGYGLDGQWSDDFHHAVHALFTGERDGYYEDFGTVAHLAKAVQHTYVYDGSYSPYRHRRHGNSPRLNPAHQFVVCIQNHDQVGNRMLGERLGHLVSFAAQKQAAALLLLSPYPPLLFMGEEYDETAPFQYFTSHSDPGLIEGVRTGRTAEFAAFTWKGAVPDPQSDATFERSRLHHELQHEGKHRTLRDFYKRLIALRRDLPALRQLDKERVDVITYEAARVLLVRRWSDDDDVFMVFHFGERDEALPVPIPPGIWHKQLDAQDEEWLGSGSTLPPTLNTGAATLLAVEPGSFAMYRRGPD